MNYSLNTEEPVNRRPAPPPDVVQVAIDEIYYVSHLHDGDIRKHIGLLEDYIDYLESYVTMLHCDCPPFGFYGQYLRKKYTEMKTKP